jgi:hypothetical protein
LKSIIVEEALRQSKVPARIEIFLLRRSSKSGQNQCHELFGLLSLTISMSLDAVKHAIPMHHIILPPYLLPRGDLYLFSSKAALRMASVTGRPSRRGIQYVIKKQLSFLIQE